MKVPVGGPKLGFLGRFLTSTSPSFFLILLLLPVFFLLASSSSLFLFSIISIRLVSEENNILCKLHTNERITTPVKIVSKTNQ